MLDVPDQVVGARVYTDAFGLVWYQPKKGGQKEVLALADEVCGLGPFNTGINDPFRPACIWHDRAYIAMDFFRKRGWNRAKIDKYFLGLMLDIAEDSWRLRIRAYAFYALTRAGYPPIVFVRKFILPRKD